MAGVAVSAGAIAPVADRRANGGPPWAAGDPTLRAPPRSRVVSTRFLRAGHLPTLFAAFLYFDVGFMVRVLLGPQRFGQQIGIVTGLAGMAGGVRCRWRPSRAEPGTARV